MAWRRPGDKPLSEPMMVSLLTHICVTRPQWVKMKFFIAWIETIEKPSSLSYYHYRNSHYKDKTVTRPSYLNNVFIIFIVFIMRTSYNGKDSIYIETGPDPENTYLKICTLFDLRCFSYVIRSWFMRSDLPILFRIAPLPLTVWLPICKWRNPEGYG